MALYKYLVTFSRTPGSIIENRSFGPLFSTDQSLSVTVEANTEEEAIALAISIVNAPNPDPSEQVIIAPRGGDGSAYRFSSIKKLR